MRKYLLISFVMTLMVMLGGTNAWAGAVKRVIVSQNYEAASATDWVCPNASATLASGDATYGKYAACTVSGSGNRSCYNAVSLAEATFDGFASDQLKSKGYVIEFDMKMSGGNVKDRSVSQFIIPTTGPNLKTNAAYEGTDYIFSLSQPMRDAGSRVTTWYVNDLTNGGVTANINYNYWYHYKVEVTASSVNTKITLGDKEYANSTKAVTELPKITGFFGLLGRGSGFIHFDNLEIYDYVKSDEVILPVSLTFPDYSEPMASYLADADHEWKAKVGGVEWTMRGFNNQNNSWDYIACGRKTKSVTSTITSSFVDAKVKILTLDVIETADVESALVRIFDQDNNPKEVIDITEQFGVGSVVVDVESNTPKCKYQVEITSKAGNNGSTKISKIELGGIIEYAKVLASDENAVAVGKLLAAIESGKEEEVIPAIDQFMADNAEQPDGRSAWDVYSELLSDMASEIETAKSAPSEAPVSSAVKEAYEAAIAAAEATLTDNKLNIEELKAEFEKLKAAEEVYLAAVEESGKAKEIAATLVHTSSSSCGADAEVYTSTVDAETEHVNNNRFNATWQGAAYAEFALNLSADQTLSGATLKFTGIGESRRARNTDVMVVAAGVALDYEAMAKGDAKVNAEATTVKSVDFPQGTSQEFEIDVTDALKALVEAGQNYVVFKFTNNPGGGDVAGMASENAPQLMLAVIGGSEEPVFDETGTETDQDTTIPAKNEDIVGTCYTIPGTYNAGAGNKLGTMLAKGFKCRTAQEGGKLEINVNEGYTITKVEILGQGNYVADDATKAYVPITKVEVDGEEVPFAGGQFPDKSAATSETLTIGSIQATKSIVIYFDNSNASAGTQLNMNYAITWGKNGGSEVPTGINDVKNENTVNGIYNLYGQKVTNLKKGLYIINGKKTIVK